MILYSLVAVIVALLLLVAYMAKRLRWFRFAWCDASWRNEQKAHELARMRNEATTLAVVLGVACVALYFYIRSRE